MPAPATPATPLYDLLFDEEPNDGPGLTPAAREAYGSDWRLPAGDLPSVFVNFAISHDARVSYNAPGFFTPNHITLSEHRDLWLMGLLRARADCVVMGDRTLFHEPEHLWTAEHIAPASAALFGDLRAAEGRAPRPVHVFLSMEGNLPWDARVFHEPGLRVVVAAPREAAARARREKPASANAEIITNWEDKVHVRDLVGILQRETGARTFLSEGGPVAYGAFLSERIVVEEFLTICPMLVGAGDATQRRPGLVEGVAFPPGRSPRMKPVSMRRHGDYLFLRSVHHPCADP